MKHFPCMFLRQSSMTEERTPPNLQASAFVVLIEAIEKVSFSKFFSPPKTMNSFILFSGVQTLI